MDNKRVLTNDEILKYLNESDFEDLLDDDDLDTDPTFEPGEESPDNDNVEEDDDSEAVGLPGPSNEGVPTPTHGPASKPKPHFWNKTQFPSKADPVERYEKTELQVLSPAQYFEKYFTPELFDTFSFHTNQYYQQQNGKQMNPPCTAAEIKVFCYPWPNWYF